MNKVIKRSFNLMAIVFSVLIFTACGGNTDKKADMEDTNKMQTTETMESDQAMDSDSDKNMNRDATADAKLNVNTATGEAFRSIPKVGDKMVHEFEEYRPYSSIQQFRREIGKYVEEDQVAEYEKYIYVPIHRNDSDAASLLQILGLNENQVKELIAARPYETNQAFLDALSSHVSDEQLATAKAYIKKDN